MLELNEERVASPKVSYLNVDVFSWKPDRRYDVVFFANWLSHIPPILPERVWDLT
jgi:demethylmenaquinone methyltransferase/2-methoxy-6-polyprenyl-1,4-benzoquinol methylase